MMKEIKRLLGLVLTIGILASMFVGGAGVSYAAEGETEYYYYDKYNVIQAGWDEKVTEEGFSYADLTGMTSLPNGNVFVVGRNMYASTTRGYFYLYDYMADTWTRIDYNNDERRIMGISALSNTQVFVTGGVLGSGTSAALTDTTYIVNTSTGTMTAKADLPEPKMNHKQSTLSNGNVYISGGYNSGSKTKSYKCYVYKVSTNSYSVETDLPINPIDFGQSVLPNGNILVTGGGTSGSDEAYTYNFSTKNWTRVEDMPGIKTAHIQITLSNGLVAVYDGGGESDDMYLYDYIQDTWTVVAMPDMPNAGFDDDLGALLGDGRLLKAYTEGDNIVQCTYSFNTIKTTIHTSNIIAVNGTYPNDGLHSDGYWYVKKTLYNTTPLINVTTSNGQNIGGSVVLSGSVSDADAGDVITVKYNIDGGATQTVAGTVTTSGNFTATNISTSALSKGAHTLNVWAEDNKGGRSTIKVINFNRVAEYYWNKYNLNGVEISTLPLGTIIYDTEVSNRRWQLVSKNRYMNNTVTLLTVNSYGISSRYDSDDNNSWGDSDLRYYLNNYFYEYDIGDILKNNIKQVSIPNINWDGYTYNTNDYVFIPSLRELGYDHNPNGIWSAGTAYDFYSEPISDEAYASRIKSNKDGLSSNRYWVRSISSYNSIHVYYIDNNGHFSGNKQSADATNIGYAPAINVGNSTLVSKINETSDYYKFIDGDQKGTLHTANIKAFDGTYPVNGIHSDGFWYVRGAEINDNPFITVATPMEDGVYSANEGHNILNLTGSVIDANVGDNLTTYYTIDGGPQVAVAGTVVTSGNFTPTDIDISGLYEGDHTLSVWAVDQTLKLSNTVVIPFKVDKSGPMVTSSNNDFTWQNADIDVDLNATDTPAGVDSLEYEVTADENNTDSWTPYAGTITLSNEGSNYVHFRAFDTVGNHVTSYFGGYSIDKSLPTVTADNVDYTWQNSDITIALTASDLLSGISTLEYELTVIDTPSGTYLPYTEDIVINADGIYYIHYRATDNAGNVLTGTFGTYKLDKTLPGVTASNTDYTWQNADIAIELTGDDAVSGIATIEYELSLLDTPGMYDSYLSELLINLEGIYYLHVRVTDHAGNVYLTTLGTYKLDKTPATAPTITRDPDDDIYNGDYIITLTPGTDGGSGIDKTQYRLTGAIAQDWTDYSAPFDILTDGLVTIEAKTIDLAGNETISTTTAFSYNDLYMDAEAAVVVAEGSNAQPDKDTAITKIELMPEDAPERAELILRLTLVQEIIDIRAGIQASTTMAELDALWVRIQAIPDSHFEKPNLTAELIQKMLDLGLITTVEDVEKAQDIINTLPDGPTKDALQDAFNVIKTPILLDAAMQSLIDSIANLTSQGTVYIDLPALTIGQYSHFTIEEDGAIIYTNTSSGHVPLLAVKEGHTYTFSLTHSDDDGELGTRTLVDETIPDLTKPVIMGAYVLNSKLYVLAGDNYRLADNPFLFTLTSDGTVIASNMVDDLGFVTEVIVVGEGGVEIVQKKDGFADVLVPSGVTVRVEDLAGLFISQDFNITRANEVLYGTVPQSIIDQINANNAPKSSGTSIKDVASKNNVTLLDETMDLETAKKVVDTLTSIGLDSQIDGVNSQSASMDVNFGSTLNDLAKEAGITNPAYRVAVYDKTTMKLVYTSTLLTTEKLVIPDLADSTLYLIRVTLVDGSKELAFREIEQETMDATAPVINSLAISGDTLTVYATDNKSLNQTAYSFNVNGTTAGMSYTASIGDVAMIDGEVYNDFLPMAVLGMVANANGWGTEIWIKENRMNALDVGDKVTVKVRDANDNYTETTVTITGADTIINNTVNANNPIIMYPNTTIDLSTLLKDVFNNMNKNNLADQKQAQSKLDKLLSDLEKDGFTFSEIEKLKAISGDITNNYDEAIRLLNSLSKRLEDEIAYQAQAVSLITLMERLKDYIPFDLTNINMDQFKATTSDPKIGYFDDKGNLILVGDGKLIVTITNLATGEVYSYAITVDSKAFDRRVMVQVNSMTDLAQIFASTMVRELGTTEHINFASIDPESPTAALTMPEGQEQSLNADVSIIDGTILKVGNTPGLYMIYASNSDKTVPLYVIVFANEEPTSLACDLNAPITFTVKEGEGFKATDAVYLKNRLGSAEGTNGQYVIVENLTDNVDINHNSIVTALTEGIAKIAVIDLVSKIKQDICFKIEKLTPCTFTDTKDASVTKLANLGIIKGNGEGLYLGNDKATIAEFLTLMNRSDLYSGKAGSTGYKVLELSESHWSYYNVQAALNGLTSYEAQDIFGSNVDKQVTGKMVCELLRIKGINVDTSAIKNKETVTRYEMAKLFAGLY